MKPYIPQPLPLSNQIDWVNLVNLISRACYALAKYEGILHGVVNPLLLLSPLTTKEAVISSKIEGTQATLEEVLEYEASASGKIERHEDIQEIINYRQALAYSIEKIEKKPISLNLIKAIHFGLLDSVRGRDKARGEFRTIQNWIGAPGTPIEKATFIPPPPEAVYPAMNNLEPYIHYDEKDRIVQLAIIHAQFEMIHPFIDGNGRVGRILIPLFLVEKQLLKNPVFYISSYLDEKREIYYDRLNNVSKNGDWNGWISFFLEAVEAQAKKNTIAVQSVLNLYEEMKGMIVKYTKSQFAIRALDAIFEKPIFTTTQFITRSSIPKASAMRMISKLKEENILINIREAKGRRPALIVFDKLMDIINI
jgi:Fic family protein